MLGTVEEKRNRRHPGLPACRRFHFELIQFPQPFIAPGSALAKFMKDRVNCRDALNAGTQPHTSTCRLLSTEP